MSADMRYRTILGIPWVRYSPGWSLGRLNAAKQTRREWGIRGRGIQVGHWWVYWRAARSGGEKPE